MKKILLFLLFAISLCGYNFGAIDVEKKFHAVNSGLEIKKGTDIKDFALKTPWKGTPSSFATAVELYARILDEQAKSKSQQDESKLEKLFGTKGREATVNAMINIAVQFVRNGRIADVGIRTQIYNNLKSIIEHLSDSGSIKNKVKKIVQKLVKKIPGNASLQRKFSIECLDKEFKRLPDATKDLEILQKKVATPCCDFFPTFEFLTLFTRTYADIIIEIADERTTAEERKVLLARKQAFQRFISVKDTESALEALTGAALGFFDSGFVFDEEFAEYGEGLRKSLIVLRNNVAPR
jgi:hypothetical protein